MRRIYLGLAIHNHQPIGNFPWVFEDAYQRAYLPMIEALLNHPSIRVSLHYSGCLLEWIFDKHPEFIQNLKNMCSSGQIELMSGGYYEPILSSIPDEDKHGQITKMNAFIKSQFGADPEGLWLAERVWEPSLAKAISRAGLKWTLVDDNAFKMVGKDTEELYYYFNTEDQGYSLKVFPISRYLRYAIPWHKVDEVMAYLNDAASEEGHRILVLGDDGEKFGVWPETYEHCWKNGWVEGFFKAIEDNGDWLLTTTIGEYASKIPPAGIIYLPCAAYDEMMEWSLPADESYEYSSLKHDLTEKKQDNILRYFYCGFWRNFMVKYPEVNRMHKKMLYVHEKVYKARTLNECECGLDYLWKAQCNCPYWHGVFGGIYLADIRALTYSNLIKAEDLVDNVLGYLNEGFITKTIDLDNDGNEEIIVEGRQFNLYLSPAEGGSIFEWDVRKPPYNVLSTIRRKKEGYHKDLVAKKHDATADNVDGEVKSIHEVLRVKLDGKDIRPVYDDLPRSSLLDHFFDNRISMGDFQLNSYNERGDFTREPYDCNIDLKGDQCTLSLHRNGIIRTGSIEVKLDIQKMLIVEAHRRNIRIKYRFVNVGNSSLDIIWGNEWNINLLGGGHNDYAYYKAGEVDTGDTHLDSCSELMPVSEFSIGNSYLGVEMNLEIDRPVRLWLFSIESLSNSEGGIEKIYQGNCLVIILPLQLDPGQHTEFNYIWSIR